jgi:hypothetical protein
MTRAINHLTFQELHQSFAQPEFVAEIDAPGTPKEGPAAAPDPLIMPSGENRGQTGRNPICGSDSGNVPSAPRVGTLDGHKFESLEVIVDNEQGLTVERTIALRPYPALKLFRDAMYAALKDKLPPDVWDYPTP